MEVIRYSTEMDRVRMVTLVLPQNPIFLFLSGFLVCFLFRSSRVHVIFDLLPISDHPAWVDRDAVDVSSHTIVRHLYPYWASVEM